MAIVELLLGRKSKPPQLLFGGSSIVLLELDVALEETHSYKNRIPRFPLDNDATFTDHIIYEPDELSITGQVSDDPIQFLAFARKSTTAVGQSRALTAYEALLAIAGRKFIPTNKKPSTTIHRPIILDIFTNSRIFTNMVIDSLEIKKDSSVKRELIFQVHFTEIKKIVVGTTAIYYLDNNRLGAGGSTDQAPDTDDQGMQEGAEPAEDKRTILKRLVDGGKSQIGKYAETIFGVTTGE